MKSVLSAEELKDVKTSLSDAQATKINSSSKIFRSYVLQEIDLIKILTQCALNISSPNSDATIIDKTSTVDQTKDTSETPGTISLNEGGNLWSPQTVEPKMNQISNPENINQKKGRTKALTLRQKILKIISDRNYSPEDFSQKIFDLIASYRRKRILALEDKIIEKPGRLLTGGNLKRKSNDKTNENEKK